jgi:arsenite methyltransferase
MTEVGRDRWAEWLAERRFGGDPERRRRLVHELAARRDKVLDLARLRPGETLLDVGCGEGLIAFGALERGAGAVVFDEISLDLLDLCRKAAEELGVLDRCRFVQAAADDLEGIEDESVDVVTTRSVLIYVEDKAAAFREFLRVLRPGGRISLFEPINRFGLDGRFAGYDLEPLGDVGRKLFAVYDAIQPHESDPMLDFDERDLIAHAEAAGFFPVELELYAEVKPPERERWDGFLHSSGNPKIPTLAEAMEQALDPEERRRLVAHLRPLVERGQGVWRMATAYLHAAKPASP